MATRPQSLADISAGDLRKLISARRQKDIAAKGSVTPQTRKLISRVQAMALSRTLNRDAGEREWPLGSILTVKVTPASAPGVPSTDALVFWLEIFGKGVSLYRERHVVFNASVGDDYKQSLRQLVRSIIRKHTGL